MQEAEDLLKKLSVKSGSFIARPYGKLLSFARLVYSNFKAICDIMVLTAPPLPPFPPVPQGDAKPGAWIISLIFLEEGKKSRSLVHLLIEKDVRISEEW